MKQAIHIRWIEAAEGRTVCTLAAENAKPAAFAGSAKPHLSDPIGDKGSWKSRLCQKGRRFVPFHRTRSEA